MLTKFWIRWFVDGISTFVGYLMPNSVYTCIKPKISKKIYFINNILNETVLVGFYGISNIVGNLKPNPLYTYILNIYNWVWLGFLAYQPL